MSDSMWQRLSGLRWEEITADWIKHYEELHNLFSLPNIIRVKQDTINGVCGINGAKAHRVLTGKFEWQRPHGRQWYIYTNMVIQHFKEKDRCVLDSYGARQGPLSGICEPSNELLGSTKCKEFRNQSSKYQRLKRRPALLPVNQHNLILILIVT